MRSRSLGLGLFCFLCGDAQHQWQSIGWVPTPTSQRPLRQHRQRGDQLVFDFQRLSRRTLFLPASLSPNNHQEDNFDNSINNNNNNNSQKPRPRKLPQKTLSSSFHTALCIVPPDEHWDTLQRARFFAHDRTYHQWPPAIRLFHPFCPSNKLSEVALDLAKIVEKYNIEPFDITLDRWTVMPMPDTMATMLEETEPDTGDNYDDPSRQEEEQEYIEVQALIEREAKKSKERQRQRAISKRRKQELKRQQETGLFSFSDSMVNNTYSEPEPEPEPEQDEEDSTTTEKPPVDPFNGPAMIALEPNERSSRRLKRLRELIRRELMEGYGLDAPTSTLWDASVPLYDKHSVDEYEEYAEDITAFRPLIPIGCYPTIDGAITVARKLRGLWDPLTFSVIDLHFISQSASTSSSPSSEYSAAPEHMYGSSANSQAQLPLDPTPVSKTTTASSKSTSTKKTTPFGCDALVMLMGEEIEMDNDVNEEMANFVLKEGTAGGFGRSQDDLANISEDHSNSKEEDQDENVIDLDAKGGDWSDLVEWLDGDDDEDEMEDGLAMVFGRAHLFTGEKRSYLAMPASSTSEEEIEGRFGLGTFRKEKWPDGFEIIPPKDDGYGVNNSSDSFSQDKFGKR